MNKASLILGVIFTSSLIGCAGGGGGSSSLGAIPLVKWSAQAANTKVIANGQVVEAKVNLNTSNNTISSAQYVNAGNPSQATYQQVLSTSNNSNYKTITVESNNLKFTIDNVPSTSDSNSLSSIIVRASPEWDKVYLASEPVVTRNELN